MYLQYIIDDSFMIKELMRLKPENLP